MGLTGSPLGPNEGWLAYPIFHLLRSPKTPLINAEGAFPTALYSYSILLSDNYILDLFIKK